MANTLKISRRAGKTIKKLDPDLRDLLIKALEHIEEEPISSKSKRLKGKHNHLYRYRVNTSGGEYRIIYTIIDNLSFDRGRTCSPKRINI